jgi:hypothetical protein
MKRFLRPLAWLLTIVFLPFAAASRAGAADLSSLNAPSRDVPLRDSLGRPVEVPTIEMPSGVLPPSTAGIGRQISEPRPRRRRPRPRIRGSKASTLRSDRIGSRRVRSHRHQIFCFDKP